MTSHLEFHQPLPLSLYVHYPWCIQKCPYCDFNSHQLKDDQEKVYLQALLKQLERTLPSIWGRPIQSVFFGGGTPSLLSVKGLQGFISQLRALLGITPDIEITLEANPGTVDIEKFVGFREAGVNRLSLGIQSFNGDHLKQLGRIHSDDEAKRAIDAARTAGFANMNLDLMFALPNQTLEQALEDVHTALAFEPNHISHYQLTLEPNTPFYRQPPPLPDDDLAWEMQQACQGVLKQNGYEHYEVSAFAKHGQVAVHNLNYWRYGDYVGLGAGAHGKITDAPQGKVSRTQMPASPGSYIRLIETGDQGRVTDMTADDLPFEFMLNALRLQKGVERSLFSAHTGLPLETIETAWMRLERKGWVEPDPQRFVLSEKGHTFLNDVLQTFM